MKKLITIILIFNFCELSISQIWIEVQFPLFGELNEFMNDSNLVDEVKDGREGIYYKFRMDGIIHEFFKLKSDKYKYRQRLNEVTQKEGYFTFQTIESDTSISYPAGQYEEEIIIYHFGKLIADGYWHVKTKKGTISGNYKNGRRTGTWTIFKLDKTEIGYQNDTIVAMYNPTAEFLEKARSLISAADYYRCVDTLNTREMFGKMNTEIIASAKEPDCTNTVEKIKFASTSDLQINNNKIGSWRINGDKIEVIIDNRNFEYSVSILSSNSILLRLIDQ